MDYEIDNLKREEQHRQTVQTLNMVELWLNTYALYREIKRKHANNDKINSNC